MEVQRGELAASSQRGALQRPGGSSQGGEPTPTGYLPWPDLGTFLSWCEQHLSPFNLGSSEGWPLLSHFTEGKLPIVTGAANFPGFHSQPEAESIQLNPGCPLVHSSPPHRLLESKCGWEPEAFEPTASLLGADP